VSRTLFLKRQKETKSKCQAGGDTPLATTAGSGASPFILSISERNSVTVSENQPFFLFFFLACLAESLSFERFGREETVGRKSGEAVDAPNRAFRTTKACNQRVLSGLSLSDPKKV